MYMALLQQTCNFFKTRLFSCIKFILNQISKCRIQRGFISDHLVISLELNLNKIERGKGYFKVNNTNNSLVLQPEYQDKIRNAIKETVDINKNANPNTLWEIINGGTRNETIKYASFKKKEQNKKEIQLNEDINKIKNNLMKGNDNEEDDLKRLKEKDQELQNLYELEIKGYIISLKADYIEGGEKNT